MQHSPSHFGEPIEETVFDNPTNQRLYQAYIAGFQKCLDVTYDEVEKKCQEADELFYEIKDGWNDVRVKLPRILENVLTIDISLEPPRYNIAYMNINDTWKTRDCLHILRVTHWRPLPTAPTGKRKVQDEE